LSPIASLRAVASPKTGIDQRSRIHLPALCARKGDGRLDPGGNRQLNHAFHVLALTKIPHDPRTAIYIAKQCRNGKTNKEAIRSLKRHGRVCRSTARRCTRLGALGHEAPPSALRPRR
jgi:hypothetical protein